MTGVLRVATMVGIALAIAGVVLFLMVEPRHPHDLAQDVGFGAMVGVGLGLVIIARLESRWH